MTAPTDADKRALTTSQAGMRLIAMMKIYNDGNLPRLRAYIADNYEAATLLEIDADERTRAWGETYAALGRQKVKQVLAAGKHQVAIVLTAEHSPDYYYAEIEVGEEYPHRIVRFLHAPMAGVEEA